MLQCNTSWDSIESLFLQIYYHIPCNDFEALFFTLLLFFNRKNRNVLNYLTYAFFFLQIYGTIGFHFISLEGKSKSSANYAEVEVEQKESPYFPFACALVIGLHSVLNPPQWKQHSTNPWTPRSCSQSPRSFFFFSYLCQTQPFWSPQPSSRYLSIYGFALFTNLL